MMSVSLRKLEAAGAGIAGRQDLVRSFANQDVEPSFANRSRTAAMVVSSMISFPTVLAVQKIGIGTPQVRWREMHQSLRSPTIFVMRSSPQPDPADALDGLERLDAEAVDGDEPLLGGTEDDRSLQRQQCGYWCLSPSSANSRPRSLSSCRMAPLACL